MLMKISNHTIGNGTRDLPACSAVMIDRAELNYCKTTTAGSNLCKQNHALMSGHSHEFCAVKLLHPTINILKNCETRVVELKVKYGFS